MGGFTGILRADQIVYDDALENAWQNYSWAAVNLYNTSPVHSGLYSISVTCSNWSALYLDISAMSLSGFTNLSFWINGGSQGGQQVQVQALLDGTAQTAIQIGPLPTNSWKHINVSTAALGVSGATDFTGFWIQCETFGSLPTFYVDDISLTSGTNASSNGGGTNAPIAISINAASNQVPISPLIYGVAFATSNQLNDLNFTMNRMGGNNETRDNWQINAHNLDFDWYFESYPDSSSTTPGATVDAFVANSKNGGAQPMMTISMIGWMPKLGSGRSIIPSYSTNIYGPQTSVDPFLTVAGNGIGTNSTTHTSWLITTNNPNDANFPTNAAFEQAYVQHLMNHWGASTNGGVRYYIMDNEHSLWFSTHQDVHPVGPTMQEIRNDMLTYAGMVKSNDPNALVIGPEEWGWNGYLYSGYDQQWSGQHGDYNPADYPDRKANGGLDYLPWLLNQFHSYAMTNNQRLLDYVTVHCYPQEGNVSGNAVDTSTELLRNQSTRVFWDTNYVDPSWINNIVMLIPRLKGWVANYYPGTKIGITEYNWGAEASINGATAQADIMGIFGREGLDLATRWGTPAATTPTYLALKMYRNYDGNKSTFGDTSVSTVVPDPDNLSAFSALRASDGALTLMVINKDLTNASPINVSIANFNTTGTAQRWQLTAANAISQLANLSVTNNVLSDIVPSQSITLYVLPVVNPFSLRAATNSVPGQIAVWLNGQAGLTYTVQSSTDLFHWSAISTNTLATNSTAIPVSSSAQTAQFFRALWQQ